MPYVNQGIFKINSNKFREVSYQFRNFQKELSKLKKDNNQNKIKMFLKEVKKFKKELNNYRYEFKGFKDTVKCVNGNINVKYERMYTSIIELHKDTKRMVKQVQDIINDNVKDNVIIKKPVKIVRRA